MPATVLHAPTQATAPAPAAGLSSNGTVRLRPTGPQDREAFGRFVQALSPASRSLRFHGGVSPRSERLLAHLCDHDGARHIAWVAVVDTPEGERIVGEARCVQTVDGGAAELAMAVADDWQGRGVSTALLAALHAAAAQAGVPALHAAVLAHNGRMAGFLRRAGYAPADAVETALEDGALAWAIALPRPRAVRPARVTAGWLLRAVQAGAERLATAQAGLGALHARAVHRLVSGLGLHGL